MRVRTAAEVEPRRPRGSSSVDESEEELDGHLARAGAALGAGGLALAFPLGLPRGRFTGASCAVGSGGSTDGARVSATGGGGSSSALVDASSAFSGASIGSRITFIYLMIF